MLNDDKYYIEVEKEFLNSLPDTLMLEDAITEVAKIFTQLSNINQWFTVGKLKNYVLFHKELRYGVYKNNKKYFLAEITKPKKTLGIMSDAGVIKVAQILTGSSLEQMIIQGHSMAKYVGIHSKLSNSEKAFLEAFSAFENIALEKKSKKLEEKVLKEKKEKEERKLQEGIEGKKHQEATAEAKRKEEEEQKKIEALKKTEAPKKEKKKATQKRTRKKRREIVLGSLKSILRYFKSFFMVLGFVLISPIVLAVRLLGSLKSRLGLGYMSNFSFVVFTPIIWVGSLFYGVVIPIILLILLIPFGILCIVFVVLFFSLLWALAGSGFFLAYIIL